MLDRKYREALIRQTTNSIKESKFSKKKITVDLAGKNLNDDEAEEIYKLGFEQFVQSNTILKFVFLGLSIFTLCLLLFAIPVAFNGIASCFVFLLGAGIVSYCLSMALSKFPKVKDEKPRLHQSNWRIKYMTAFILGAIFLGGTLYITHGMKESKAIDSDGIKVIGVIVDGSSFRVKRTTTYSLDVKFKTLENKEIFTSIDVNENVFYRSAKNQPVLLEYSKSNPKLVRIADN